MSDALLNEWQRGFPLVPRPYAEIGGKLGMAEDHVLAALSGWLADGTLSRIGVVFAPRAAGASTLAAMRVPPPDLERVASLVSAQPEVNHNYEREHAINLWFVATAPSQQKLDAALERIGALAGLEVLSLPMVEEFHIDLGFDLATGAVPRRGTAARTPSTLDEGDRPLVAALEGGFPLVPRPYAAIGERAGLEEATVIARLARWVDTGIARRVGLVLRHRSLGIDANAMAVWDVPDEWVPVIGAQLAAEPAVTLCYRRERRLPQWPYNLYCMLHGRDRGAVVATLASLRERAGLAAFPHAVLFSARCFKQRGANYSGAARYALRGGA